VSDRTPTTESVIGVYQRAWNAHDPRACAACFAEDGARRYRTGPIIGAPDGRLTRAEGRKEIAADIRALFDRMPDLHLEIRSESYGSDRRLWVEWRVRGTLRSEGRGGAVDVAGVSIFVLSERGIREELVYAGEPPGPHSWPGA
jgi:SnoaL-like protein